MFDNTHVNRSTHSNHQTINAVSGTIVKTHPNSFFRKFSLNCELAELVFSDTPRFTQYAGNAEEHLIVTQVMLCGDSDVLIECIYKPSYDLEEEGDQAT